MASLALLQCRELWQLLLGAWWRPRPQAPSALQGMVSHGQPGIAAMYRALAVCRKQAGIVWPFAGPGNDPHARGGPACIAV